MPQRIDRNIRSPIGNLPNALNNINPIRIDDLIRTESLGRIKPTGLNIDGDHQRACCFGYINC